MGRIIGKTTPKIKLYTNEEVSLLTKDLTSKIEELTLENISLKDEKDMLVEANNNLNGQVIDLTSKIEELGKSSKKNSNKENE